MASVPALYLPKQDNILDKYAQLQQIKQANQQSAQQQKEAPLRMQALQQQVQTGEVQAQQQQQQLKNQQALTQAYQKWDGKSLDQLSKLALEHGASGDAVQAIQEHALKQRATYSQIAKDDAATGASTIATKMKQNDAVSGALKTVLEVPDDQLPQTLVQTAQGLAQQGLLDPQHVQAAQQIAQAGDASKIRTQLDIMRKGMMSDSQLLEESKTNATIENEKTLRAQAAARDAQTAKHQTVEEKQGAQRIGLEGARLNFERAKQGTQDQQSIDAQAQQMAVGDLKLPPQGRSNPLNAAIRARAFEINPQLSDELYATKQDFLSSKGKANSQVQSLNKLSAHLQELQDASSKAGFSPVGFTEAGKDLRLAEQLFSKEDVKFLSGSGVGTEGELNGLIEKTHSPVQSVRDSAIQTLSKFTADAARQLGDQFERGTKLKFDPNQHFTPATVQMMDKHGGTSARTDTTAPAVGTEKTFPNGNKGFWDGHGWVAK